LNACATCVFQMEGSARQNMLGTYDYVAVGVYYVVVLTVSVYVSLLCV
jgi:hypothetical protein